MRKPIGVFFKALSFLLYCLPLAVRIKIAEALGILWFDVLRIRRKVALENLRIAFPEKTEAERIKIGRASLMHMGRTLLEFVEFPFFTDAQLERRFTFKGMEHVERALEQKKGVLFLALHVGNGDFASMASSRKGLKLHLISKVFKAKWLNDMWFGMRAKHGTKFISPEKSSFEILRALRRNEIVIFVLDQFMGPPIGVRTKFFGKETGTAAGLALMAERTGAPVMLVTTHRDGHLHRIEFGEPIPYLDDRLNDNNTAVMTQVYTDKIESIVRRHPEQWMWIHRRWKEFRD